MDVVKDGFGIGGNVNAYMIAYKRVESRFKPGMTTNLQCPQWLEAIITKETKNEMQ